MPHGLLIAKMSAYDLSNNAEFMSTYLCDRYPRVKISNNKSSWTKMLKGIHQGSGLGPFVIIVEFYNFWVRRQVFAAKKGMKGTGVSISEQLPKETNTLFYKCRQLRKGNKIKAA